MAYNWYEYLVFARNLRDNPAFLGCVCKDETIKRNIVSRAYYSAFHHSKKYADRTYSKKLIPNLRVVATRDIKVSQALVPSVV